ncbi:beta-eliminating lyase-related protein [Novosphingobium sp. SG707]|uniref:threonine aldolase family protein n=1 Tax=Novosphingobium sp. SG707 TaxID=2586996 RepID=UPI001445E108|nr:beta-eliminating lyase-related protein [Novosphingobium sp. SG707]NKI99874.1 threonine aldolase [Novosphingobium sp. SG707]
MPFMSDNAAPVHPAVWAAMHAADAPQPPYDGDSLSAALDDAFSALFGRPCAAIWVASGTAANCLALAAMVRPYEAVLCHELAHIERDECGAPGFFTHGAKLILAGGEHAKMTPETARARLARVGVGVEHTPVTALSITQANEAGCVYSPGEVAAMGAFAREKGLRFHMDGARFANAVAHLGCSPAAASCEGGVEALSFGFVKNGGMGAEALIFFAPDMIEVTRFNRKRAGHLQSKGRYLAAQLLAMLKGDLWLDNARRANAAAGEIAAAAGDRLIHPVQANEVFVVLSAAERAVLREAGFAFYDWDETAARFVTAWNSEEGEVMALAKALRGL